MSFNPWPVVRAQWMAYRWMAWLTLMLVALAVATGVAVIAQERALRQGSARAADDFDLLVGAPGSATQLVMTSIYLRPQAVPLLDASVLNRLTNAPGVKYAAPIAFGDRWRGYPIVGTTVDLAARGGELKIVEGRLFTHRQESVIGARVPLALGEKIHPQHGLDDDDGDAQEHHEHQAKTYTVVGRLPARNNVWDQAILVPVEDVWQLHGLPDGHALVDRARIGPPWDASRLSGVPAVAVKPDSVATAYRLRGEFRGHESMALFPAEVLNELYLTLGNVRDLMTALTLSTQVLVVLAILMAVLLSLVARRKQWAVLQAMGASRAYVLWAIWLEVAGLLVAGAVLGVGLGWAFAQGLSWWLARNLGFALPVQLGWQEWRLVLGLLLASALIVLIPALVQSHREIVEDLM